MYFGGPGLERCAGELVTDMMQVVERCDDPEEGEMKLVVTLFPLFTDMYKQMEGKIVSGHIPADEW